MILAWHRARPSSTVGRDKIWLPARRWKAWARSQVATAGVYRGTAGAGGLGSQVSCDSFLVPQRTSICYIIIKDPAPSGVGTEGVCVPCVTAYCV